MNPELLGAIDRLVPPARGGGDWDDVLRRAGVERAAKPPPEPPAPPKRRRRRTLAVVGAVLALAIALLATPALGVQGFVLDLLGRKSVSFDRSPPAPNVVKKRFADLAIGAPPRFAPGVQPAKAREVGRFRVRGRLRALWVAPTSNGGYCFAWDGLFGGCRRGNERTARFEPGFAIASRTGEQPRVVAIEGEVPTARARRLVVFYGDGTRADVPFVWVSKPIAAGFFAYTIPRAHQQGRAQLVRVALFDARGRALASSDIPKQGPVVVQSHTGVVQVGMRQKLPTHTLAPTPPLQRGGAGGVDVTAGANGSVVFDTSRLAADRRPLVERGTSYSCFRLARVFGIFDVQGLGYEGRLQRVVALRMNGLRTPFDGCELAGSYGHRWPDRLDSHGPIEIALTDAGGRFFADRAAARDLALFVRTRRVQRLRREPPRRALADLRAAYGRELAHSRIRIERSGGGLRFSETSSTGRTFYVVVARGRITKQNVKPYALVF